MLDHSKHLSESSLLTIQERARVRRAREGHHGVRGPHGRSHPNHSSALLVMVSKARSSAAIASSFPADRVARLQIARGVVAEPDA